MQMTHVVTGEFPVQRTMDDRGEMVNLLNDLARNCVNGHLLYAQAAWKTHSEDLFALFDRYSSERNSFINELHGLIEDLGGQITLNPDPRILQQDYPAMGESEDDDILLPSIKSVDNIEVIWLARCLNHDWETLVAYEYVLKEHLPIHIHAKITEQYVKIARDIDTLELLYKTHHYWSA